MQMATKTDAIADPRTPLSRERVLRAAISLADEAGMESLSMRKLADELGVKAMSLYNHVTNKEDLLNGMVDILVGEIDLSTDNADWKTAMRNRMLSAREVLVRHPWAYRVIESRKTVTSTMLKYMDSIIGIFRDGGFSIDLAHHAMHALGSRLLGFTQELFDDSDELAASPDVAALLLQQMTDDYPNISAMMMQISHDEESTIGSGCDDMVEFVFTIDLILDGLERLRDAA